MSSTQGNAGPAAGMGASSDEQAESAGASAARPEGAAPPSGEAPPGPGTGAPPRPGPEDTGLGGDWWQTQMTGLGAFIRMQRRLADMSLREMANLTSVSNAYLSQIERGLHQPSLRVLRSIAQALSIAPEDLLRRANFMAPQDDKPAPAAGTPEPPDTETAILADPRLSPGQRDALLNVYRSFRDQT